MMFKVFIQDNLAKMSKDVYIVETNANGRVVAVAEPVVLTMKEVSEGQAGIQPTLEFGAFGIGEDILLALKDSLTDASLGHTQGELKSTKAHLDDMRAIAFHKLNMTAKPQSTKQESSKK